MIESDAEPGHDVHLRRLTRTSALAWIAITVALTLYVVRTYPSEHSDWFAFGRQIANWMPFGLVLPVMFAITGRLPKQRHWSLRAALFVAISIGVVYGYAIVRFGILRLVELLANAPAEPWQQGFQRMWPIAAIIYCVQMIILFGVRARVAQERAEHSARRLQSELAEAQLASLQAQIRPHFLFNTLQAIDDACWRAPETASKMIQQLSQILRNSLDDDRSTAKTLRDDLELARTYVALQRARFEERLRFTESIDPTLDDQPFPPLWLQPLLENAIFHGIEKLQEGGEVHLSTKRQGNEFCVTVTNDGPREHVEAEHSDGIGFANARDRLRSLFGDSASLTIRARPEGGAVVEARAPIAEAE